ncbi:hypothetical protein [Cellulomonas cellasea]|uniref:Uncharacterized protein n=1 Tax=Cellulomonas cellasea TaxID=43670 RepID=A0A7W4UJX6_9CELL|nr:hypothetical protein [Cellulomonas cellasea]MBB2925527.1 hypothetical protein [Cellulomonas cellasea]
MSPSLIPDPIDTELSEAVVAYFRLSIRDQRRPDALSPHAVRRSPEALLDEVCTLIGEVMGVPVDGSNMTIGQECQVVHDVMAPRHPELSSQALAALMNYYWRSNR